MRRSLSRDAKSPAVGAAFAFAGGILLGLVAPVAPAFGMEAALVAFGISGVALGAVRRSALFPASALLLLAFAGFWSGRCRVLAPAISDFRSVAALDPEAPVEIVGRITSLWSASGSLRRATLKVEEAKVHGVFLNVDGAFNLLVGGPIDPGEIAGIGDRIRIEAPLRLPDGPSSQRTPFQLPPRPMVSLKSARMIEWRDGPRGVLGPIHRVHRAVHDRMRKNLSGESSAGLRALSLLEAMLMGETADLGAATSSAFRDGGVAHLLVIAGLHVGLLALLFGSGLRRTGTSVQTRDVLLLVTVLAFTTFAGGRPPVFRATLTIGFYLCARLVGRPPAPGQVVGLSALLLLIVDPSNIVDAGFQLSYAAVFGLALFGSPISAWLQEKGVRKGIADALGATVGAELAVFPIQAIVFNVVPLIGIVSNLVAIPIAGFFLAGGLLAVPFLLFSPVSAALAIVPLRLVADLLIGFLSLLDTVHAVQLIPTPSFFLVSSIGAALLVAGLAPRPFVRRGALALSLVLCAVVVLAPARVAAHGTAEFHALDVGQGDAWLLVSPQGSVLVDGGGTIDEAYDFGRLRLVPKLADLGAVSFDAVVLSHPHPDHARGLLGVLSLAPVGRLVIPRGAPRNSYLDEVLETASRRGIPVVRLGAGESLRAAGFHFAALHPGGDSYPRSRENNGSLVLRTELEKRSLLLTGDIESAAERDILARPASIRSDVLKVAHHGSRTSTTLPFLSAVAPRVAWIGVGRHNRFGHPTQEVLERLEAARTRIFRTDRDGDASLHFRAGLILPQFALFPPRVAR